MIHNYNEYVKRASKNSWFFNVKDIFSLPLVISFFWNEVPYTRVKHGTYSTESETLPLPWPALRYRSQNIPEARWQCVRVYAHTSAVGMLGSRCLARFYAAGMLEYRCLARTYAERPYPKPADSVSAIKEKPNILSHTSTDIWHRFKFQQPIDFNFLHFATFWISFCTSDIL